MKTKVNFKTDDITKLETNNYNTHIHKLCNISRAKGSQTMKRGQLIEYNRNIKKKKMMKMRQRKLVPDLFFFLKKGLI